MTSFPESVDTFPSAATLATHNLSTDPHSTLHGDLGDAVTATQTTVLGFSTSITSASFLSGTNKEYTGAVASNPALSIAYAPYGTSTATEIQHNAIAMNDLVDNAAGATYGFAVTEQVFAGARGAKTALFGKTLVTQNPGGTYANSFYVGTAGRAEASVNAGGSGGGAVGSLWGGWFFGVVSANATYYAELYGIEIDMTCLTAHPPERKIGLLIAHAAADSASGTNIDTAINIASQTGTTAIWNKGITFGQTGVARWPFDTTSTLIGTQSPGNAAVGIDFTGITFSGAQYKGPGFSIAGAGPGSFAASDKYLVIDASGNVHKSALGPAS